MTERRTNMQQKTYDARALSLLQATETLEAQATALTAHGWHHEALAVTRKLIKVRRRLAREYPDSKWSLSREPSA